jgi:hypothetical protein
MTCPYIPDLLLGFYGGFTAYARLIKSLAFGDQFNLQPISLPQRFSRQDWKSQLSKPAFVFSVISLSPQDT